MARRSLLSRLLGALRPTPQRRESAPRPPQSPPEPPEPRPGGSGGDPFRQVWREENGQGSYGRSLDFFDGLPALYDSEEEELETWRSFVRYMVNNESRTRLNSTDNPFWSQLGIAPQDFDWAGWRSAMGYSRKR